MTDRLRPTVALASSALFAALSIHGLPAKGALEPVERPNVLIVTVDTLRPDALGWISGRNETPVIDRLATRSLRFSGAISPVPITLPSHSSIFSGRLPRGHGVRDNGQTLPQDIPTLAEALSDAGYSTAAFVSGFPLQRIFGLDRGFGHYDDSLPEGSKGWLERRAPETTAAALEWLQQAPEPWFAWVHYYDPHDPYDPPRSFWQPGPRGSYDGEVALVDHSLGQLLAGLGAGDSQTSLGDPGLLIALTADHGEALGEHEESTHGYFIYDSTIKVPLMISLPGRVEPGASDLAVRLIDLAPTILDLLGLPALRDIDGRSFADAATDSFADEFPAYIETRLPWVYFGWSPLAAIRAGGWKLVAAPRPELYDLQRDPDEAQNLIDLERRRARELITQLRNFEAGSARSAAASSDPESLESLRSLGYVGSGNSDRVAPEGLADPKDRIAERRFLLAAEDLMRAGRSEQAIDLFDQVLAVEPDNRYATLRSGVAALELGQVEQAVLRLTKAVELDPARAEGRYALADALMRSGSFAAASQQWMEVVRLQPRRFEGWFNLGLALLQSGKNHEASQALAKAIDLGHDIVSARIAYARSLLRAGDVERSRKAIRTLLSEQPNVRATLERDSELAPLLSRALPTTNR